MFERVLKLLALRPGILRGVKMFAKFCMLFQTGCSPGSPVPFQLPLPKPDLILCPFLSMLHTPLQTQCLTVRCQLSFPQGLGNCCFTPSQLWFGKQCLDTFGSCPSWPLGIQRLPAPIRYQERTHPLTHPHGSLVRQGTATVSGWVHDPKRLVLLGMTAV